MQRAGIVFFALMLCTPSFGVEAIDTCIHTDNDLDRLACYDRASGRTPAVSGAPAPTSAWFIQTETSALTDDTNVYLSVDSEEVVDCGWNSGAKIQLAVRCMENTTALIFTTGCHMTSSDYSDYGDVTYRIDDQPARTIGMTESTDNKALGLWSGGKAIPVIKQLFGGRQLIARMVPFSENPFTATFNISGLETASKPLREQCGW